MTNPNNGATLEDCHSNFFALTDLCGIKWRRLVSDGAMGAGHPHHSCGPLDDPVLHSYAKCLASNILCVWRTSPNSKNITPSTPLPDQFNVPGQSQQHFFHPSGQTSGNASNHPSYMQPNLVPPNIPMGMGPGQIMMTSSFPQVSNSQHGTSFPPSLHSTLNNPSLNGPKELWLFWYGEDPDLTGLVNPQLLKTEGEQGSWEGGLSYDCRTLLFKALHNLIERCLLSRDFIRLGKWFIQPCDDNQRTTLRNFPMQLSFSFSFFLHGDSTVCTSVDVRQHPVVRRITKQYLTTNQSQPLNTPVILAPYGLAGTLTGVVHRVSEPATNKILEEWKQFYPIDTILKGPAYEMTLPTPPHSSPQSTTNVKPVQHSQAIPPVIEVLVGGVGGVRMRYPSCYVLVTEMDDSPRTTESNCTKNLPPLTNMKSRVSNDDKSIQTTKDQEFTPSEVVAKVDGILSERVWQECILCSSKGNGENIPPSSTTSASNLSDQNNYWEFVDPTKKSLCSCSKCKRLPGSRANSGHGSSSMSSRSTKIRRNTFHRRSSHLLTQVETWSHVWDSDETSKQQANSSNGCNRWTDSQKSSTSNLTSNIRIIGAPATPIGGPQSKGGPASMSAAVGSEGGPSPASVAPATPRSQASCVPQQDSSVPAMSPQSSSDNLPTLSFEPCQKPVSSVTGQGYSPMASSFEGAKSESAEQSNLSNGQAKLLQKNDSQNCPAAQSMGNALHNGCPSVQYEKLTLKRPELPSNQYEPLLQDENQSQPSEITFDYDIIENWLSHPFKRRKTDDEVENSKRRKSLYNWGFGMKKLPEELRSYVQNGRLERAHGRSDPYEFEDENHVPPVSMAGLKRKDGVKQEDDRSPPCISETINDSNNLFTIAGLQPSFSDLDKIFDNSDTSSDETFQAPTPPGSNKPAGCTEELMNNTSSNTKQKSGLGILRPEELSKMFPTPPSHEHNPIASPCAVLSETTIVDGITETTCIRRQPDSYTSLYSPPDEPNERKDANNLVWKTGTQHHSRSNSQDWSYVYKVPVTYKMVGSTKYTPLPMLPSQCLPPLTQIQNCVYKASWHKSSSQQQQHSMPPPNVQSHSHPPSHFLGPPPPVPPPPQMRPGLSPISPAPSSMRGHSFEMGSPPSNMYLKQGPHGPVVPHGALNQPIHHQHPHVYGRGVEAHALVVNLSLADSLMNLFRDHNFDSCTMCVCNAGNRVVGNIKGSEVGVYIPDPSPEDPVRCSCGFSSSVNRRLAHRAGLFYEDEHEITTAALAPLVIFNDEWYERKKQSLLLLDPKYANLTSLTAEKDAAAASSVLDNIPPFLLELLREQYLALQGKEAASRFTGDMIHHRWTERTYNHLEYLDGNRAAHIALEHGRTLMLEASGRSGFPRLPEETLPFKPNLMFMHKWGYLWARGPQSSQDTMHVMKSLLPLLQNVVHNVYGPLTWRQIHRLAGRGTDDLCEPQPIPSVLVTSEKDFLALSPLSIKFWEKLLLEPYAYPRDIGYLVVAPDNEFVLQRTRTYFRELSTMYEVSQLGRHCPITKLLRDGILRVSNSAAEKLANEPVDEWFTVLPDIPVSSTLRLYAQVCRYYLAAQLAQLSLDQSLLDPPNTVPTSGRSDRSAPSPKMPPPNTNTEGSSSGTSVQGPPTPKSELAETEYATSKEGQNQDFEEDERDPPAIVIYLVEPFGYGSDNKELHRMATLGLLRCFSSMLAYVPEYIRNNITLQIVSLEDILSLGNSSLESKFRNDQIRAVSLTVYSQCRRLLIHQNNVRSLTGFGPAAGAELFLKSKDDKKKNAYKLYTPPFILAPLKEKVSEGIEWLGGMPSVGGMVSSGNSSVGPVIPTSSSVLYVAYCLSEDQRWLLASATDDRGELLETTTISIYVPNRSRRRKASARKHGLQKLMDFILGIMSIGVQPWRLVVGRVGRIGHGELESWSTLLSRKSLVRASNQLKDACRQCSFQYPVDTPSVLSACLVSLEPDSCLRLMPDQFTPDERFGASGSSSSLSTPSDVSCTHILVFPTSATTQSSQTAFQEQHINPDVNDDDLIFNTNDDIMDGIDGMNDLQLGDIFSWDDAGAIVSSPAGSPRRDSSSQPGSPGMNASGRQSPFQTGGQARASTRTDSSDELGTLLQQPLALGYIVSTSDSGQLPSWFWASCPQRASEKGTGIFLKSALHLHSHSALHNLDDILPQQSTVKQHPLDSQYTTDVLRFVLEGYNALSWLCLDPVTHDRKSCLPVHIQKLMQLYFTISALV